MEFCSFFIFLTCVHGALFFRFSLPRLTQTSIDDVRPKRDDILKHTEVDDYYDQLIDIRNLEDKNDNPKLSIHEDDCINCGYKKNNTNEQGSKSHRSISIHNKYKFKPIAVNKLFPEKEHKTSKVFDDTDPFKEITYYMNDYIPGSDMLRYEPYPDPWSGADTKILPKPIKGVVRELNSVKNRANRYNPEVVTHANEDFILSNSQEPEEMKYKIWNALRSIRNWINN